MRLDRMASPLGTLLLVTDAEGCLLAVDFHDYEARLRALRRRFHGSDTTADGVAPAPCPKDGWEKREAGREGN